MKIETEYGLHFKYNPALLLDKAPISLNINNRSIEYLLMELLNRNGISFNELKNEFILYSSIPLADNEFFIKPIPKLIDRRMYFQNAIYYVYDSVNESFIDTVITYKFTGYISPNTTINKDTVFIALGKEKCLSRLSIDASFSQSFTCFNTFGSNGSSVLQEIEKKSKGTFYSSFDLHTIYYFQQYNISAGLGVSMVVDMLDIKQNEMISFSEEIKNFQYIYDTIIESTEIQYVNYEYDTLSLSTGNLIHIEDSLAQSVLVKRIYNKTGTKDSIMQIADTLAKDVDVAMKRYAYYITLPLSAGYQFAINKKFELSLNAGLDLHILMHSGANVESNSVSILDTPYNPIALTGKLFLKGSYLLHPKIAVSGGLNIQGDLMSRYKPSYNVQRKMYFLNIGIGLKYYL